LGKSRKKGDSVSNQIVSAPPFAKLVYRKKDSETDLISTHSTNYRGARKETLGGRESGLGLFLTHLINSSKHTVYREQWVFIRTLGVVGKLGRRSIKRARGRRGKDNGGSLIHPTNPRGAPLSRSFFSVIEFRSTWGSREKKGWPEI